MIAKIRKKIFSINTVGRFQAYKTRCSNTKQPQQKPFPVLQGFQSGRSPSRKISQKAHTHDPHPFGILFFYDKTFQQKED